MATRIDETITVHVPADRAWETLTDLSTLAACVPDAELISSPDAKSVLARLGTYNATARVADRDDTKYSLRLIGAARAASGPSAALSLTLSLRPKGKDSATLKLDGDIELIDAAIKAVPPAKIKAFAERLRVRLEHPTKPERPSVAMPTPTAVPSLATTGMMPAYKPVRPPTPAANPKIPEGGAIPDPKKEER
jgi:uncharacterized protein